MSSARHGVLAFFLLFLLAGCPEKKPGVGVVSATDDAAAVTPAVEAGPAALADVSKCTGCQLTPTPAWSFEGIYADSACTNPIAQIATAACALVPALGDTPITYVDEVGGRKAGEQATVTLTAQVSPETPRFRKTAKTCVRSNETAVAVTPLNCTGARVCRDAQGALTCTACRALANGCPDFEETRLYASISDPAIKNAKAVPGGGGGNVGRLAQCCAALASQAQQLGASPEAGMLASAAAQCTAMVKAAGPNGTAPELGVLRSLLAGRNIPALCAGF